MSIQDCPYVGLQPYTEEDREFFFGREKEKRVICSNLYAAALTVLYGASGVGKSSVLRAGVMPQMAAAPATVALYFNEWQDAFFLRALKGALIAEAEAKYGTVDGADDSLPLDEVLARLAKAHDVSPVLVLDQFEEYFLYHPEPAASAAFEAELASAVNREECRAGILISLRDDWLSRLDRFSGRIPALLANTLRLEHLSGKAAEEAIREPLKVHRERFPDQRGPRQIDDDLVAEILRQVRTGEVLLSTSGGVGQAKAGAESEQIETAFLQLVLTRVWNEEKGAGSARLRLSTFALLGGARQIVRAHLDDVMGELSGGEQESCSNMFQYLVTPRGAKIAHETADLVAFTGRPANEVTQVLEKLNRRRVLRRISPPERYEIFHDVLAPAVLDWRAKYVQGREQAELERRAAEQARQAQRFRRLSVALAGLALVSVGLMIALGVWSKRLETSKRVAEDAKGVAVKKSEAAELAADKLEKALKTVTESAAAESAAKTRAEQEARQALAHQLAGAALTTLGNETGILLALAAVETTRSVDGTVLANALDALRRAAPGVAVPLARPGHYELPNWPIRTMVLSGDGKHLATATQLSIQLWEADSGKHVWSSPLRDVGHTHLSRDGTRLATLANQLSYGYYTRVEVLDALSGRPLEGFPPDIQGDRYRLLQDLVMDEAGERIAVGAQLTPEGDSRPGQWRLYNIANRGKLGEISNAEGPASFSPNGSRFAAVSDRRVGVWEVRGGSRLETVKSFDVKGQVRKLVFSEDGNRLAAAFRDAVTVWSIGTGRERQLSAVIDGTITGPVLSFSPDGKLLAIVQKNELQLRSAESGDLVHPLHMPGTFARDLKFSENGRLLTAALHSGRVCRWEVASGKALGCPGGTAFLDASLSARGEKVAMRAYQSASVLDVAANQTVSQFPLGQEEYLRAADFSRDATRLVTASERAVRIWDVASGQRLFSLEGIRREVVAVGFSPDGSLAATGDEGGGVRIWESVSGKGQNPLPGHKLRVMGLTFRPDGKVLATVGYDREAKFWDVASGKEIPLRSPIRAEIGLRSIAFSPDSNRIATGSTAGVKLWAVDGTGGEIVGPGARVLAQGLAFGGQNLLAAVNASEILLFHGSHGWRNLPGSGGGPSGVRNLGVAFTRDGRWVAGGGDSDTLRIWDVSSGQEVAAFYGHSGAIVTAAFSPDERNIHALDINWNVYRHPVGIRDLIAEAGARVKRKLSDAECREYLHRPCPSSVVGGR